MAASPLGLETMGFIREEVSKLQPLLMSGKGQRPSSHWVGQKVHSGFPGLSYRKTPMNFLAHPVFRAKTSVFCILLISKSADLKRVRAKLGPVA